MKNLMIGIISVAIFTTAGMAVARDFTDGPDKRKQRQQQSMQGMPVMGQLMGAIRRLDLSDEQKENVWNIMHTLKGEMHPVSLEMKSGQQQLKELVKAEDYDKKAVAALAKKEGELIAKRIVLSSDAAAAVLAQLTEEQRTRLDAMATERKQRSKGKRQKKSRAEKAQPEMAEG